MGARRAGPLQENIEMKTLTTIALAALLCFAGSARAESTRSSTRNLRSSAREKLFLGLDGDFAVPVGNFSNVNGVGAGVLATAEYPVMPELSATARVGFQYHANKNVLGRIDMVCVPSSPIGSGVSAIPGDCSDANASAACAL